MRYYARLGYLEANHQPGAEQSRSKQPEWVFNRLACSHQRPGYDSAHHQLHGTLGRPNSGGIYAPSTILFAARRISVRHGRNARRRLGSSFATAIIASVTLVTRQRALTIGFAGRNESAQRRRDFEAPFRRRRSRRLESAQTVSSQLGQLKTFGRA